MKMVKFELGMFGGLPHIEINIDTKSIKIQENGLKISKYQVANITSFAEDLDSSGTTLKFYKNGNLVHLVEKILNQQALETCTAIIQKLIDGVEIPIELIESAKPKGMSSFKKLMIAGAIGFAVILFFMSLN